MTFKSFIRHAVLLPCSKLYGMGTYVRNKMFDWKILRQHKFDVPVIVVGNIAVGGTGKTPHAEYIIESLRNTYHVAFLSRGYKRRTKGFVLATSKSAPRDIGDEAYQVYHKFGGDVTVAVCENRVQGIQELLSIDPGINMLVLDDAFQHRYVKPTVAVVVTEYNRPLFADSLLPYGRLRESARGLNRADLVIVSKCPEKLTPMDYRIFSKNLNLFPYQSLFYSRYSYQPLRPVFPDAVRRIPYLDWLGQNDSVLAVAGIGNPRPFVRYLKGYCFRVKVNVFPDHHDYTRKDIELLKRRYGEMKGENRIIVTTEKDAVRLSCNPYFPHELKAVTFYLPIKVEFTAAGPTGSGDFGDVLRQTLKLKKNNSD
ncbi:tetraacyldisaccharide 4'-kinase [Muribaculum intestinale]|uniref:tetraacyldisaccharide 4'-kinase n=1 Tax=Muribaculum intestinale TaxID=1796646 RepID=UPI002614F490|nr:tetraacyldisaccharide 4'-kinase [Muribaculum intestinale]